MPLDLVFGRRRPAANHSTADGTLVQVERPACFVRQAIFTRTAAVAGYELRFQATPGTPAADAAPGYASARILSDVILSIGLETLTGGKPLFLTMPRAFLLEGIPRLLPSDAVVLQLATDVTTDDDCVEACTALKSSGYRLALDAYEPGDARRDLLAMTDVVSVSWQRDPDCPTLAADMLHACRHRPAPPVMLATNVHTVYRLDRASRAGFELFQGSFFGEPVVDAAKTLSASRVQCLQLMRHLNRPDLSLHDLESVIKRDAMLTYRTLRVLRTAASPLASGAPPVESIERALVLLGLDTVRRWATIWTMASLAEGGGASELMTHAVIRARCCELLDPAREGDGFLLGLCSLLGALLRMPTAALLEQLPLSDTARRALAGEANPRRLLLDCIIAYERGEWDACAWLGEQAGVDAGRLPVVYRDALTWARGLSESAA
jgi:EAL and modified HD-GYP domain-containing signal transduction protein